MARVWKITVGHEQSSTQWKYCKSSGRIVIGYAYGPKLDPGRIRDAADFEDAAAKVGLYGSSREQVRRFWSAEKDDLVVAKMRGRPVILGIGFVKSKRVIKDTKNPLGYESAKLVDWLAGFEPVDVSHDKKLSQSLAYAPHFPRVSTIHEITDKYSIQKIVEMVKRLDRTKISRWVVYRPPKKHTLGPTGRILSPESIAESSSWGVRKAMGYEESKKRRPEDVSDQAGRGYDILSKDRHERPVRCIEVKARKGWRTEVALTENQYETARRLRDDYYVYIITGEHEGRVMRNPAGACKLKKITLWVIEDWEKRGRRIRIP